MNGQVWVFMYSYTSSHLLSLSCLYLHVVACPFLTSVLLFVVSSDVGFKVGRNSGMSYFVLQIHYGDVSAFKGES